MKTYIIKRLLLMIPTFFVISLILFVIINIAPGMPGAEKAPAGEIGGALQVDAAKREAFQIFKSQFNLDKPVIFNTWFALKTSNIEKYLNDILNEDGKVSSKDIIKAQEDLENYGQYAVPHLVEIMNKARNSKVRDLAVNLLSRNAQRKLIHQYGAKLSENIKKKNIEINEENVYLRSLKYEFNAPEKEKLDIIAQQNRWYNEHRDRFQYSFSKKIAVFFTDTRFAKFWWNLLHFDFGISHVDKKPVIDKIVSKLKYSFSLSIPAVLLAYIIAVPLGIFSAVKQNSLYDRIIALVLFMFYALPSFFVATLLLFYFSKGGEYWHIFPTGGFQTADYMQLTTLGQIEDIIWHLILPIVCLTYASFASISRYARTGLLEVIRSDYIRTARAKGLPESVVIMKHAVRNGIIPIITLLGTILPVLVGGSVIIEYIFGIPGMGLLTIDSIWNRDYNVIMGIELVVAILIMIGILLSDILYSLADPRIRF